MFGSGGGSKNFRGKSWKTNGGGREDRAVVIL